jgi:hypothetical protein
LKKHKWFKGAKPSFLFSIDIICESEKEELDKNYL